MTLQQRLIPLEDSDAWQAALQDVPHAYTHSHWYNQAMHVASKREIFLYEAKAKDFYAVCPISPRRKAVGDLYDITTPYGFSGFASIGSYENFANEWQSFMSQQHFVCGHIAQHPLLQNPHLNMSSESFAGKSTFILDLNHSADTLFANFSHGHQYDLKRWQKKLENNEFVILRTQEKKYQQEFVRLYEDFLIHKQASGVYNFGNVAWQLLFASPHLQLFVVLQDEQMLAAATFIHYGTSVDYFMVATTLAGREHARGIIWHALQHYQSQEAKWLHLGCGVNAGDSLEQFKARFGGKAIPTISLKQIYQPQAYQALAKKYQVDPEQREGYFPNYWQQKRVEGSV